MITFDELFAHRIYYQDVTFDEFYIIKKLKQILVNDGMEDSDTNKYLFDFYESFGYSMNLEDIEAVTLTQSLNGNNLLTSFFNFVNAYHNINSENLDNSDDENNNNSESSEEDNFEENNPEENNPEENNSDNINSENINSENLGNLNHINLPINFSMIDQNNLNNLNEIDNNNSNLDTIFNIPNNGVLYYNFVGNGTNLSNEINNQIAVEYDNNIPNNTLNNNNLIGQMMMNILNNTVNINTQNTQEDILVTMDKKDIEMLEVVKYDKDTTSNCTICLMDVEKDNEYYKIKCNHIFHTKCIEKWLEEFNYICPVCRTELGEAKPHIENNNNSENNIEETFDNVDYL